MKRILMACTILLSLAACQKENSVETPGQERLAEVRFGDEYAKFEYAANGQLTKAIVKDDVSTTGEEVVFNISYGSAGQISEVQKSDGETIRPMYQNNRLVKAEVFSGAEKVGYTDYIYENNLLKTVEIKFTAFGDDITTMKFVFTYDAQQRIQRSHVWLLNPLTDVLEDAGYSVLEYDNKTNPLYQARDFMLLLWDLPSPNNITKETQFLADNTLDETREYTYTYNSKNQPASAVQKTTSGGQQSNTNITFRYQ